MINFEWANAPLYAALYVILINLVAFGAFALDKHFAKNHMWRISEKTLLLLAAAGGAVGAIIGQRLLRHKTQKQPFKTLLLVILVINFIFVFVLLIPTERENLIAFLKTLTAT